MPNFLYFLCYCLWWIGQFFWGKNSWKVKFVFLCDKNKVWKLIKSLLLHRRIISICPAHHALSGSRTIVKRLCHEIFYFQISAQSIPIHRYWANKFEKLFEYDAPQQVNLLNCGVDCGICSWAYSNSRKEQCHDNWLPFAFLFDWPNVFLL